MRVRRTRTRRTQLLQGRSVRVWQYFASCDGQLFAGS